MYSRSEAQKLVDLVTFRVGQYAAVHHHDAVLLLGQATFDRMMLNKIKNLGPVPGTVYPWNVIDYLSNSMGGR